MDEIAVRGSNRIKGAATSLAKEYLTAVKQQGILEAALRTDENNSASMALFKKLDFLPIPDIKNPKGNLYDPEYPTRIYLTRKLEEIK